MACIGIGRCGHIDRCGRLPFSADINGGLVGLDTGHINGSLSIRTGIHRSAAGADATGDGGAEGGVTTSAQGAANGIAIGGIAQIRQAQAEGFEGAVGT